MDLTVIATYRCNSKCAMCHVWKYPTKASEEVTLATLDKLPGGFDNVNITGGEPTLRADLAEMADMLHPKARILEISSNGLFPDDLEPIIRKHPDIKVRFSLEGFEETNNRVRGEVGGFQKKVGGLMRLKKLGGTDLGFGAVIQDDNADELVPLYKYCQECGVEMATSALHNAFQFHKNDNYPYDRLRVAKSVEGLITELLKTNSVKNWFRAYLNLGLIRNILGHDRLIPCTAGRDFIFIDPWSDVYACNVWPETKVGNLMEQSWDEILGGARYRDVLGKVASCRQNCWMVTTARCAMRSPLHPSLPKLRPALWVLKNKLKVALGRPVCFDDYIDYSTHAEDGDAPERVSYLGQSAERTIQSKDEEHYNLTGGFFNR
jgi:Fe-coproporphyrin III synthase